LTAIATGLLPRRPAAYPYNEGTRCRPHRSPRDLAQPRSEAGGSPAWLCQCSDAVSEAIKDDHRPRQPRRRCGGWHHLSRDGRDRRTDTCSGRAHRGENAQRRDRRWPTGAAFVSRAAPSWMQRDFQGREMRSATVAAASDCMSGVTWL
jgi:hypothetical protein